MVTPSLGANQQQYYIDPHADNMVSGGNLPHEINGTEAKSLASTMGEDLLSVAIADPTRQNDCPYPNEHTGSTECINLQDSYFYSDQSQLNTQSQSSTIFSPFKNYSYSVCGPDESHAASHNSELMFPRSFSLPHPSAIGGSDNLVSDTQLYHDYELQLTTRTAGPFISQSNPSISGSIIVGARSMAEPPSNPYETAIGWKLGQSSTNRPGSEQQLAENATHLLPYYENTYGQQLSHELEAKADEPYAQLLYRAFMSNARHAMTLQEIYQWFRDNTDKAKSEGKGWQNSIRHNLSMNGVSHLPS
jgi:hypothetical protein